MEFQPEIIKPQPPKDDDVGELKKQYPEQPDKRPLEHRLFDILERRTGTLTLEDLEVLVEVVTKGRIEGVYHFDIERAWDKLKEELSQYLKKSVEKVKSYLIRII
jgi:hypothetical protein